MVSKSCTSLSVTFTSYCKTAKAVEFPSNDQNPSRNKKRVEPLKTEGKKEGLGG